MAQSFTSYEDVVAYYSDPTNMQAQREIMDIYGDSAPGYVTEKILKDEADRLRECIQRYIDLYYESYKPKVYQRSTHGLKEALKVDTVFNLAGKIFVELSE